jgi:hypothetical protein
VSDRKDDLRRQFETVLRMAGSGLETLREVVVRSSQAGKLRVDVALLAQERRALHVELGQKVAALIAAGALEVPSEVRRLYDQLREVEERISRDSGRAHDNAFGAPRGYEAEAGSFDDELESEDHEEDDPPRRKVTTGAARDSR